MKILFFFIFVWYSNLFMQSFFHHRYSAHSMFTMSNFWEKFFYILAWIFLGPSYLSPSAYGKLHRLHHAYADTEKDPHSPMYSKNLFHMLWKTRLIYNDILNNRIQIEDKFLRGHIPNWPALERFADSWVNRFFWILVYISIYYLLEAEWWMYFTLLPIQLLMSPVHGVIINWFAHIFGSVEHKVNDTSKNLLPIDIFMLGESYHNNHHANPKPNFGEKWYQIDPIYPFILLFNALGIIRLAKVNQ